MRTDAEREERAIWKLKEAGYTVRKDGQGYVVTSPASAETTLSDLAALVEMANTIYAAHWTGRKITPSA